MFTLRGNTFAHRDKLLKLGGSFDRSLKAWVFPYLTDDQISELKKIIGCTLSGGDDKPSRPVSSAPAAARETVFYGDDKTYHNRFNDKNPVSFFGFSSMSKYVKFIEEIPQHKTVGLRATGHTEDDPGFNGSRSMKEAINLARNGWPYGARRAQALSEKLLIAHATNKRKIYSVAGGRVSVGKMLAGNPKCMSKKRKIAGKRNITLFVEFGISAIVTAYSAIVRAACIAALCDVIEANGYSCEIIAVSCNRFHMFEEKSFQTTVKLKSSGEKLNISDIVFALGHPSFCRRFEFASVCQADELHSQWRGQGTVAKSFNSTEELHKSEYLIPSLLQTVENENILFEMCKPKNLQIEIGKEK